MYTHPANFILNLRFKMKKPCYFPVDFVYCRENRYSEFLFYLTHQNSCSSANIGRANVVCRVRWANIWTRSVHYITLLCIWPHIIFIILLIIGVWTISFSGKKKKRFTCDHTCKVCVIQSYLFWISYNVNNMNTQIKEKVLARLGRLRLQGALVTAPERCV